MKQNTHVSSDKKLVVVADKQTTAFFTLVGAIGFEQESTALQFIRKNVRSIGGILVATEMADTITERIDRMQGVDLPIIRLPDGGGVSQIEFLESLMEKAIGMKLENNSLFGSKK